MNRLKKCRCRQFYNHRLGYPMKNNDTLFLAVPAFAANSGYSASKAIVSIFIIIGIGKCISIAKRETTSSRCVYALVLALSGWLLASLYPMIMPLVPHTTSLGMINLSALIILEISAACVAVMGLTEYRHGGYVQGKKQAVWTIIISLFLLSSVILGLYQGYNQRRPAQTAQKTYEKKGEARVFEDLNFKYAFPGKPYVEMNAKSINPEATFVIMRSYPLIYFMIIAEQGGVDLDIDSKRLCEISKSNLQSAATDAKFIKEEELVLNNMQGICLYSDATALNLKIAYVHWVYSHNGYLYQLIAWGRQSDRGIIYKEAKQLFTNFNQLEPEKIIYSASAAPFGSYTSSKFGYTIDLQNTAWTNWTEVHSDYSQAEIGGITVDNSAFMIFPVVLPAEPPSLEALTNVLLKSMAIKYPDDNFKDLKSVSQDHLTGQEFNYQDSEDPEYRYRFRILAGKNVGYLVSVMTWNDNSDLDRLYAQIIKAIRFDSIDPSADRRAEFSDQERLNHATHYNRFGIFFYKAKQYDQAVAYFKQAINLVATDAQYILNCMDAYNQLGQYQEALTLLEKYLPNHKSNQELSSWHAWLLKHTNRPENAIEVYQHLFSTDYRNDEDFTVYVRLLADAERRQELQDAFEAYLKKRGNSLDLILEQAKLLAQFGEHEKAIRVLKDHQEGIPFNAEIAYNLIRNYTAMDQPKQSLEIAKALIVNGYASSDAYYAMGKAEFELKWYRQAKESFENALRFNPDDEYTQDYIRHISALLGEGDNTCIKDEISPVRLPKMIADKLMPATGQVKTEGYDSLYLNRIKCVGFDPGKELKNTTYLRIKVMDAAGVSRFSSIEIDFNPLSEKLFVNNLSVMDESGKITAQGKPSDYYIIDKQDNEMATFDQTLHITVSHLEPGNIIDLTYTRKQLGDPKEFLFYTTSLSQDRPVRLSAVCYVGDPALIRYTHTNAPAPQKLDHGLAWIMENPPVYRWEPEEAPYEAYLPIVRISDSKIDWHRIGQKYFDDIKEKLALDEDTRGLAKTLVKSCKTNSEKIAALVGHVQAGYTYKAIEFGRRAWVPHTAAQIIENKYGDCKDHAVLVHQLLKAMGVPSFLALVNTGSRIEPSLPSLDQFNHMIVFIPDQGGGRFVDATDKDIDAGTGVPVSLGGKWALILQPENVELAKIPEFEPGSSSLYKETAIEIENGNDAAVSETISLSGYCAAFMRGHLKTIEKVRQLTWAQSLVSKYQRSANVTAFQVKNLYDNSKNLTITLQYRIKDHCREQDGRLIAKIPSVWEQYYLTVQPVKHRKKPFKIYYPFEFTSKISVNRSAGVSTAVQKADEAQEEKVFGDYTIRTSADAASCRIDMTYRLRPGIYPADLYQEYQLTTDRLLRSVGREIRIDRPRNATAILSSKSGVE